MVHDDEQKNHNHTCSIHRTTSMLQTTDKKIENIVTPKNLTLTTENTQQHQNQQYNYSTFNDNILDTAKSVFKVR